MKKKEAMDFIREKKGYVPYVFLFEMFNDEDEISQALIDMECEKEPNKSNYMICSGELAEQINKIKNECI